MRRFHLRSLLVAVVVWGLPIAASAQQLPSPAQAEKLLQNPAAVAQLQQRIAASGLTPDQIRARLRAAGYPETMLDQYLGSSGSAPATMPSADVFSAVSELGLADSMDVALIRCGINPDTISVGGDLFAGGVRDTMALPLGGRLDSTSTLTGPPTTRILAIKKALVAQCAARLGTKGGLDTLVAPADSGFAIFGMDFFRRASSLFAPNFTGPVDEGYQFGPGDKLVLILTGDVEASYSLDVNREGFVTIPQVGLVYINGLTKKQLEDVLYTRLGKVYSGIRRGTDATTHFSVSAAQLRSNLIYVTGNVMQPGAYDVSSAGTLLTALYAAGGPSDNGSLRDIELRRNGQLVSTLDFYSYLMQGNSSGDLRLQNGDVVYIPIHLPRVRIVGEVMRPATYEIKQTETLADVFRFAQGFTPLAARQRVQIERIVPPAQRIDGRDRITTDVMSDEFVNGFGPALPVAANDVIRVFPVSSRMRDRIMVNGNVRNAGAFGLRSNMMVADALRIAGGVKPDTYLDRVLVARLRPDGTHEELRVQLRDTTGVVEHDFPLHEDDEITVFSRSDFRPERFVAINGAVRHGGQFPYREGMTMRDLVLLAGGVEQSALLSEAKIARLPNDRSTGATAQEFTVALDSSYLFERSPDGTYMGPPGLPAPAGPSPDVALKPYDNVLILRQPNWQLQHTVTIVGEVMYPGVYTLLNTNERLTDIIKRAGGLTSAAYPSGIRYYRLRNDIGRIGIDLPDVLDDPHHRDNLLVQDGDSILIPRYSAIVRVEGGVNSPLAVSYVPGQDINYYIMAAGGPSARADVDRAYVTQPNGKVETQSRRFLITNSIPRPRPGSVVYVPEHDASYRPADPVALTGAIAGVLSSLVAIAIALGR